LLQWHTLVQLVNRSYRCFLRQQPDLDTRLARIFGEIEAARKMLRATLAPRARRTS
jgi:hypothetical protein